MNINSLRNSLRSEETRRRDLQSVAPSVAMVPGRVAINGSGEAYVEVAFSIRFTSLPYFTFGFERQETSSVEPVAGSIPSNSTPPKGQLPTGSAHVSEWKTIERLPFGLYYVGAKIAVVTEGLTVSKLILNYTFTGTALSNPSI